MLSIFKKVLYLGAYTNLSISPVCEVDMMYTCLVREQGFSLQLEFLTPIVLLTNGAGFACASKSILQGAVRKETAQLKPI